MKAAGVDPEAFEGEDGPPNAAHQRTLALLEQVKAEARERRN